MKEKYIALMETALSAYPDAHIRRYLEEVKRDGLTEHGFPRLTANIGILIARGRRQDLLPLFSEMMELCCKSIPKVKAANDFSVREIVWCLYEIERAEAVPREDTERWRGYLATIDPLTCYNKYATSPTDNERNWALFTALSEVFRCEAGLGDTRDFIELQLVQQLQWMDENGMYRDNIRAEHQHPTLYDMVSRGLFALLLDRGYRGKHAARIDAHLKKAGLMTLAMQSPNGEIPFGGRSNQFLHNEPWLIALAEYEAKRYAREGDLSLAAAFRAAAARALAVTERWLAERPIRHIKNRYPTETKYGCENYAYFDKYMITVASQLYFAYLIADDSLPIGEEKDDAPVTAATSPYFHKVVAKCGGYGLEWDVEADPHYDSNGLGRIHRVGAPSSLCLSCPCPSEPVYAVDIAPVAFSICSALPADGGWRFGAEKTATYELLSHGTRADSAEAFFKCHFADGRTVTEQYRVSAEGVTATLTGEGEIGLALPALCTDGETTAETAYDTHTLTVAYRGWRCRYETDGTILPTDTVAANRNGHYRAFIATAHDRLTVRVVLEPLASASSV